VGLHTKLEEFAGVDLCLVTVEATISDFCSRREFLNRSVRGRCLAGWLIAPRRFEIFWGERNSTDFQSRCSACAPMNSSAADTHKSSRSVPTCRWSGMPKRLVGATASADAIPAAGPTSDEKNLTLGTPIGLRLWVDCYRSVYECVDDSGCRLSGG
jgi:hypothetical protein